MTTHPCLAVLDDYTHYCTVNAFIELPTRQPALMHRETSRATYSPVDVQVLHSVYSTTLLRVRATFFWRILHWLFDDGVCQLSVSRTTHRKVVCYSVGQAEIEVM